MPFATEVVGVSDTDVFARRLTGTTVGPAAAAHLDTFPGGTIGVSWPGYTCPPGEGSPSAYNFTTSVGTFPNGQSSSAFGASERNSQITVPVNVTSVHTPADRP